MSWIEQERRFFCSHSVDAQALRKEHLEPVFTNHLSSVVYNPQTQGLLQGLLGYGYKIPLSSLLTWFGFRVDQ